MWKWIIPLFAVYFMNLSAQTHVLAFAGSTRKDSFNKQLIKESAKLAQEMGAKVTVLDLKQYPLPLYDADYESDHGQPVNAKTIRDLMIKSDVILIATPEYNGSMSGTLKNLIDWTSRNEEGKPSRLAFKDKKFVIMSATAGPGASAGALTHLKSSIENIGGIVLAKQISVPNAHQAFDAQGQLANPNAENELKNLIKEAVQ